MSLVRSHPHTHREGEVVLQHIPSLSHDSALGTHSNAVWIIILLILAMLHILQVYYSASNMVCALMLVTSLLVCMWLYRKPL